MNILLIGNGAREHAIAEAIVRSPQKPILFSFMKANNPGIAKLSSKTKIGGYDDLQEIVDFARSESIEFAFIGPEDPLNNGIVDAFEAVGIPCIGPKKQLAALETSKSFTRNLLHKYNIDGNPKFKIFTKDDDILGYLNELEEIVIKPDGLTGGKGVRVQGDHFHTKEEAYHYCLEVLKTHKAVVVEEKLDGEEFSLQCLSDGFTVIKTPPAQDHKRAFVDDKGPNTGGMGSYSCEDHLLPFLKEEHVQKGLKITQKVCDAIREETGIPYKGVMYGGFIVTKNGVKLIEYNARFGDPEAMNVLPILKTDFVEICKAIIDENLKSLNIEFENKATVCKYAVPEGYPEIPKKDEKIDLSEVPVETKIYFASVDQREDGLYTSTSRAIGVVGIAPSIEEAEQLAEKSVKAIKGPLFHREDIGTKTLIQKRIDHMNSILK
ncbi:phosphoribosylamine--glycine ligase [Nanoarchaeota archaeon]